MAVKRRLRLRAVIPRLFSRSSRNAAIIGASISSKASRAGDLCRRCWANCRSKRKVSR